MIAKIKRLEFRNTHINDEIYKDMDVFLFPSGIEKLDPAKELTTKEFEKMLLYEPNFIVVGTGFKSEINIDKTIFAMAKKNNVEVVVLQTEEAAKKYQDLARKGKKVVAKLHINC